MESFRSVIVEDGNGLLGDDGAGIHSCIQKMHTATGHLDTIIQCLFPGLETGKGWQQRRMNIDDAPIERPQEFTFQHAHKAGERYQIDLRFAQRLDIGALGFIIELGAKLAGWNESGRSVSLARAFKDFGIGHVAQHERYLGRNFPRRAGVGDSGEVRALARTEYANAEFGLASHGRYLQAGQRA